MTREYTEIQELLPSHRKIPCMECDGYLWVSPPFHEDEWYCRECLPEDLREKTKNVIRHNATVRL